MSAIPASKKVAMPSPGRICPLRYRYGAAALSRVTQREADTLYVVGGLYGNIASLDAVEAMSQAERGAATVCFNGDFNWFNVADAGFVEVNRRVLAYDAILGNVEAELQAPVASGGGHDEGDAGCGCAYPDSVDAAVVERSNRIHRQLRATARRHPELRERLARLPMLARYRVGRCRVGVVHGDADSLAGWRFDVDALDDAAAQSWLRSVFAAADVDLFASTHTCLPALRAVELPSDRQGWVVNNGAAGMPNFAGDLRGLCTRIGIAPSAHPVLHEVQVAGAYVALLPIAFDNTRWRAEFLAQWPAGSPAWQSYFDRITRGPSYARSRALPDQATPVLHDRQPKASDAGHSRNRS